MKHNFCDVLYVEGLASVSPLPAKLSVFFGLSSAFPVLHSRCDAIQRSQRSVEYEPTDRMTQFSIGEWQMKL